MTFFFLTQQPEAGQAASFLEFLDHTQWRTIGRIPLARRLACRRDLYLKTRNTDKRQTSMLQAGFEASIPASNRPQTLALDLSATRILLILSTATLGQYLYLQPFASEKTWNSKGKMTKPDFHPSASRSRLVASLPRTISIYTSVHTQSYTTRTRLFRLLVSALLHSAIITPH